MILYSRDNYIVKGNEHTIKQLHNRSVNSDIVKSMIGKVAGKIAIQETVAIISKKAKLIVLRINHNSYFLVTCLDVKMFVKKTTIKIYI